MNYLFSHLDRDGVNKQTFQNVKLLFMEAVLLVVSVDGNKDLVGLGLLKNLN